MDSNSLILEAWEQSYSLYNKFEVIFYWFLLIKSAI